MKNKLLYLVLLITCYGLNEASAQWNSNPAINTPLCLSNGRQIDLRMMEDGAGGTFVTWKDYRASNGLPDIYAQRFDAFGYPMWIGNGVVICDESHDQSTPAIVSDMRGGAIIAWSDWRSMIERDIYAQRIDANGNIKWTVNGMNVTDLSQREHSEKIVSDGKGGVIIAFEKQNGLWDIWAQRLDSSGNKMWGQGGVALTTVSGNRRNHKIQKDQHGGAIVTWQDLRNGSNYDIYAQRLDSNGNLLWGTAAKPVCAATGDQINAKIESDSASNGAYIAWQDTRSSADYDIYMQRLDSNGNAKWATDGIVISNQTLNQSALDMMSLSGGSEVMITWKDSRSGNYDIYAQKVGSNGSLLWNPTGVVICNSPFDQINPNICSDENKGAIIVWQDSSAGMWDIKTQRINNAGNILWTANGEVVCNAANMQTSPKNISDGKGGSIYAWQDVRNGEEDIFIHHINKGFPAFSNDLKSNTGIELYPNPAHHVAYLKVASIMPIEKIMVTNVFGVMTEIPYSKHAENSLQLDLSKLKTGIYVVHVIGGQEEFNLKLTTH